MDVLVTKTLRAAADKGVSAVSVTGGEYSVGCTGTFTSAAGTAVSGDDICVRHTSSPYPGAVTTTTLRVGAGTGTSDAFESTTEGTPCQPEMVHQGSQRICAS